MTCPSNHRVTDVDAQRGKGLDPAELYCVLHENQEAARKRRIEEGRATYGDFDDAGKREYKRRRQAERRAKLKERDAAGAAALDAETIRHALADAVLLALATGDDRADHFLWAAASAFEIPDVAAGTIRRRAPKLRPRVLGKARTGAEGGC